MPRGIHMIGRKLSEETRKKMRETHLKLRSGDRLPKLKKGERLPVTEEGRKKQSDIKKKLFSDKTKHPRWKGGKPKCIGCGERLKYYYNRRCWKCFVISTRIYKGNKKEYRELHQWVEKQLGKPEECSKCGKKGTGKRMHWANRSGKYRRNIFDWIRLCPACHKKYDMKEVN